MFDLPSDYYDFDLIHISWGGVNWAPDIDAWARIVASRLKPGGAVLISEMHPLWFVLSVTGPNALTVRAALLRSGLRIEALYEQPDAENYAGLGSASGAIPAVYYLKASRPPE